MPRDEAAKDESKYAPECYACPIGTVSMAIQGAAPDATDHLLKAGREVLAALKSVIEGMDSFLSVMEERSSAAQTSKDLQAIPIRRGPKKA